MRSVPRRNQRRARWSCGRPLLRRSAGRPLLLHGVRLLTLRRGPRRGRSRGRWCGACDRSTFAVGEPDIIDRMLNRVQSGAGSEGPAGEDALDLALQGHLLDLDEGIRVRRLRRRPRVAHPRRDLQRAELHRLVDGDIEGGDAAGNFVEAGKHGGRIGDLLRRQLGEAVVRRRSRGRGRRRGAARLSLVGRQSGERRLTRRGRCGLRRSGRGKRLSLDRRAALRSAGVVVRLWLRRPLWWWWGGRAAGHIGGRPRWRTKKAAKLRPAWLRA